MNFKKIPIKIYILALLLTLIATGCSEKKTDDVRIELIALDQKDVKSSNALFPCFVSSNEKCQKELDDLNKEVESIRKDYEIRTEKDKTFIVHTYVSDNKNIPQCTILWYEEHSLLDDDYNLITLAYNTITGKVMMSKEALNSLQIDGITLSTNVANLYSDMELPGKLKETEMQGFETDEEGNVTYIYMKLTTEIESTKEDKEIIEEKHFYCYKVDDNTMFPLSDKEYTFTDN